MCTKFSSVISFGLQSLLSADASFERPTTAEPENPRTSLVRNQFHSSQPPKIHISDYVDRLERYLNCSPECFIIAIALIRRYINHREDRGFLLMNVYTIHRLYAVACVVAAKMRDDIYFGMSYYGQVVGILPKKLLEMEITFFVDILAFDAGCTADLYFETLEFLAGASPFDIYSALSTSNVHTRRSSCFDQKASEGKQNVLESDDIVAVKRNE